MRKLFLAAAAATLLAATGASAETYRLTLSGAGFWCRSSPKPCSIRTA